jgi:hypothetical protein
MSVPVTVRSKVSVCGRSLALIVGSNPTGGQEGVSLSFVCCPVDVSATS